MKLTVKSLFALVASLALIALTGCDDRDTSGLSLAEVSTDPVVFDDDFVPALEYHAFEGSFYEALDIDDEVFHTGYASLVFKIPVLPGWIGGAFNMPLARDLTGYNALTAWSRASEPMAINQIGFGVDVTGTSFNEASIAGVEVDTNWRQIVIPIPNPDRLDLEMGLFFVSDSEAVEDTAFVWLDDVEYDVVGGLQLLEAHMEDATIDTYIGLPIETPMWSVFELDGDTLTVDHGTPYFDYTFSDTTVAVFEDGKLLAAGIGTTTIGATLDGLAVTGELTVTVGLSPELPAEAPELPSEDVLSLFCGEYAPVKEDIVWNTYWQYSTAKIADMKILGDDVKVYSDLNFVGIEFKNPSIDVSEMTHFHIDLWIPEGSDFKIELVDFGDNDIAGPYGNDSIGAYEIDAETTPAVVTQEWISLDIPLTDFTGLTTFEHMAQLVLSSTDAATVFVDNVYFHK